MKEKVSIIVPIYNVAKYLPACIESILKQTYDNLEVLLINDGSTDDSSKIIKTYAQKDSRIKVFTQKNFGQSSARNLGLRKATGKYVSFIDGDDEIKPSFIEQLLKPYQTPNTILSVCGIQFNRLSENTKSDAYINDLREKKPKESFKAYILYLLAIDGRLYSSVNKLYLASIAKTISFATNLNFAEDTKYVLDYLARTPKGQLSFVKKALYTYNYGTETSTMQKTSAVWQNWQQSYNNLKSWLGPRPSVREKFWLHTVRLRWRISFIRTKHRLKH